VPLLGVMLLGVMLLGVMLLGVMLLGVLLLGVLLLGVLSPARRARSAVWPSPERRAHERRPLSAGTGGV
jgi:hypothetical protein